MTKASKKIPSKGELSTLLPPEILAEPMPVKENLLKKKYRGKKSTASKEEPKQSANNAIVNVAILSEDGFEEIELTSPKHALEAAGAHVDVICPHNGTIKALDNTHWGKDVYVDIKLSDARPERYDAVILPGGVMNPDKLRQNKDAIMFLKHFINAGKPVAAICHGAQTLIETGMLEGKTMTSYPSLKTDLKNAGVNWVDKEVVHYGQFITSRMPADLGAFNRELIYALSLYDH
jgi:protease I